VEAVSRCRRGQKWLETALNGIRKRCTCSADLEPLEYPFALTRWQVRVFSTVIQPLRAPTLGVRQSRSKRWRAAGKPVRDNGTWLGATLTIKDPTQETLGGHLIAPLLNQDIQCDSVLIDGSPQPVALPRIFRATSSRCHLSRARARRRRNPEAKVAPNLVHHCLIDSWLTTTPRSARRSRTSRKRR